MRDRGFLVSDTSHAFPTPQSRTESNTPTMFTSGRSGNIVNRGILSLFMFFKFIIFMCPYSPSILRAMLPWLRVT